MSQGCPSGGCSSCNVENCGSRQLTTLNDVKINKIIGILSGKGGVGKSMLTSLLAIELANKGYKVGIMDADITGPSIPKMFGLDNQLFGDEIGIFPGESKKNIKIVSMNMMLETEDTPVLWRGPILGNVLSQFYSEVHWGELDYLLIDMPPGTGDVAISVMQTIPVDGFVMVSSPSKLVSMVVGKTINMANTVNSKVYGLVENMAYVKCPDCGKEIKIYNDDDIENISKKFNLDVLAKLPIDPDLANKADNGLIDDYNGDYLKDLIERIEKENE